jgi:hypothetical protein
MLKYLLFITAILTILLTNQVSVAQFYSRDELVRDYTMPHGGLKLEGTPGLGTGETGTVFALVPNIPLSLGKIAYDSNAKAHVLPSVALGLSYSFVIAKGTGQPNGGMYLNPLFIFGFNGNAGVQQDPNNPNGNILPQASVGLHIGFVGFAFAYQHDFITGKSQIGFSQELNGWFLNKALSVLLGISADAK